MKAPALLLLTLALVSCNSKTSTKDSSSGAINASAPYKWTTAFPKTIKISTAFSDDEEDAIEEMGDAWTDAVDGEETFFSFSGTTTEKTHGLSNLDSLYDSTLGVYKAANWPDDLPASALAVTQIFGRRYNVGDEDEFVNIEHADIIINDDFYQFDTTTSGSGYDFPTVVLHEMGHFLGLQHLSINRHTTVMYKAIDDTESKRVPLSIDIANITGKYDLDTGASSMSAAVGTAAARPKFQIKSTDKGSPVKILLELRSNGDCVHKENGVEFERHSAPLK